MVLEHHPGIELTLFESCSRRDAHARCHEDVLADGAALPMTLSFMTWGEVPDLRALADLAGLVHVAALVHE